MIRVCARGVQTSGDSSLTTIISHLQSAQPAKAQGHLWTRTFSSVSLPLFCSSFPSSGPHLHSFSHFTLRLSPPVTSSLSPPLTPHPTPPNPNPVCPPLTLCLLSVNSFFLFLVCWPRLTYFSLSLFQLSLPRSQSPSFCLFWFLSIFPSSLWETQNRLHMRTHTYGALYMHIQGHKHANEDRSRALSIVSTTTCTHTYTHTHTALLMLS